MYYLNENDFNSIIDFLQEREIIKKTNLLEIQLNKFNIVELIKDIVINNVYYQIDYINYIDNKYNQVLTFNNLNELVYCIEQELLNDYQIEITRI